MPSGRKHRPEMKVLVEKVDKQINLLLRTGKPFVINDVITPDIVSFARTYDKEYWGSAPDLGVWLHKLAYNQLRMAKYRGKAWKVYDLRRQAFCTEGHALQFWGANTDEKIKSDELKKFVPHHLKGKALTRYIQPAIRELQTPKPEPTPEQEQETKAYEALPVRYVREDGSPVPPGVYDAEHVRIDYKMGGTTVVVKDLKPVEMSDPESILGPIKPSATEPDWKEIAKASLRVARLLMNELESLARD